MAVEWRNEVIGVMQRQGHRSYRHGIVPHLNLRPRGISHWVWQKCLTTPFHCLHRTDVVTQRMRQDI